MSMPWDHSYPTLARSDYSTSSAGSGHYSWGDDYNGGMAYYGSDGGSQFAVSDTWSHHSGGGRDDWGGGSYHNNMTYAPQDDYYGYNSTPSYGQYGGGGGYSYGSGGGSGYASSYQPASVYVSEDVAEVVPGQLFLGNVRVAENLPLLRDLRVTHVLNATRDCPCNFTQDFAYMQIHIWDHPSEDLGAHLEEAFRFIDSAISNGGRVFVHCVAGISRSTTCVLYYMMVKNGWAFRATIDQIRTVRWKVNPNYGFLQQLLHYYYTGASSNSSATWLIRGNEEQVIDDIQAAFCSSNQRYCSHDDARQAYYGAGCHIAQALRNLDNNVLSGKVSDWLSGVTMPSHNY